MFTHNISSLYDKFPPEKAFALAQRLEIHYTPKYGSWLNIAEKELAALSKQCLEKRRIDNLEDLNTERKVCKDPGSDFTRNRKITFYDACHFMIEFQSKSLPNEVMDYFGHTLAAPLASAYIQQRQKILTEGWDFLFHSFVHECSTLQCHIADTAFWPVMVLM
jgi:hypothetical protein